ncbi:MAG: PepSY domain-containing protein [Pseudomonadota bacterium]
MPDRRLLTLTTAFCGLGIAALAQTGGGQTVTKDEAIAIALEAQPGTVAEAELDLFEGKAAYDIEILDEAGDEIEFKIDAETGEILDVWTDDDPSNDPESDDLSMPDLNGVRILAAQMLDLVSLAQS